VARFGPFAGTTSDSGADGIGPGDLGWVPTLADAGQLDGRFEPGERLAATRALLRAGLSAPLLLGRWLRLTPSLGGAASAYAFDAAVGPLANAWAVASATAETELARRYGPLRHAIIPRLAWRMGTGVSGGSLPAFGYDGWDRGGEAPQDAAATFAGPRLLSAAPSGPFQQGRASVETRLDGPMGEALRFEAGQDFDLRSGELAESFATLRASVGPVTAAGAARYAGVAVRPPSVGEPPGRHLDAWTEVRGSLRVRTAAGYDFHTAVRSVGPGGSPSEQGGVDTLFDLRPTPLGAFGQANAGVRLPIGRATVGYDLLFTPRAETLPACNVDEASRPVGALHVQQHAGTFVWNSPCRCFRATITVKVNDCGGWGLSGGIDLSPKEPAEPQE
jgi:LPS-assembly protein